MSSHKRAQRSFNQVREYIVEERRHLRDKDILAAVSAYEDAGQTLVSANADILRDGAPMTNMEEVKKINRRVSNLYRALYKAKEQGART